jgi:hypothetical protein
MKMEMTLKEKVMEIIGGIATIILFDGFIIWALFIAPLHLVA